MNRVKCQCHTKSQRWAKKVNFQLGPYMLMSMSLNYFFFIWYIWDLRYINHYILFNAKSILCKNTSIFNNSFEHVYAVWMQKKKNKVFFQTIQFSMSIPFSFIQPTHRTLSGYFTPDQSGPGSDVNEGILHIPQIFGIFGASSSDFLVSFPGHSLEESYPFAEKHSVSSTTSTD